MKDHRVHLQVHWSDAKLVPNTGCHRPLTAVMSNTPTPAQWRSHFTCCAGSAEEEPALGRGLLHAPHLGQAGEPRSKTGTH